MDPARSSPILPDPASVRRIQRMRPLIPLAIPLMIALLAPLAVPAAEAIQQKSFESGSQQRTYAQFVPDSLPADTVVPLLIVLHGSGGRGGWMVQQWQDMAQQQRFIVVGPDSTDVMLWRIREDGPVMFRDLVLAVAREHMIDTRRIYLFGQSGGAVYALTLSLLESEFFAATAIHAGGWREPKQSVALDYAMRKIPIAIFSGSRDPYFPVKSVTRTIAALKQAGHPTAMKIIPRHDHDYQDVVQQVNPAAWDFMQRVSLPATARFQEYE